MSKPFDATSKDLIEAAPADWVTYLGRPTPADRVAVIDADLSAVTAAADKVIRVADDPAWVLHLEFQTRTGAGFPRRLLRYNALLHERHGCPVATAVVLLRPAADHPEVTGEWAVAPPVGHAWAFRYRVVRVWEQPVEPLLTGGLALLPLAPIAAVPAADVPAVIDRMKARLDRDAPPELRGRLWTATGLLMGLRFDGAVIETLLAGVQQMEESSFYQLILSRGRNEGRAEGRAEEAQRMLRRQATERFGPPPPDVDATFTAITDPDRLESLALRIFNASTWQDLLAGA